MRAVGTLPVVTILVLLASACGSEQAPQQDVSSDPSQADARMVGPRYGISFELPEDWYGRLSRGALVAATFPVPPAGSVGLREMAFPRMEADDVRALLFENAPENRSPPTDLGEFPELAGKLQFKASDFGSHDWNSGGSVRSGHGFARRTFRLADRLFVVFIETGERPPSERMLAGLNALLGSLAVEPGDFYPGRVEPPRFAAMSGWHVGDSGSDEADADGEFTTAWAATVPYGDAWNALPPFQTLERLPRDGIVLWLGLSRTNRFPSLKPDRTPPFRLADFEREDLWEGQVRDLPEYRLWGTVRGDTFLDLRVYFSRPDPSPAMLAAAQAMLDGVELPEWGPWEIG